MILALHVLFSIYIETWVSRADRYMIAKVSLLERTEWLKALVTLYDLLVDNSCSSRWCTSSVSLRLC